MTYKEMMAVVKSQLATDMNCGAEDFDSEGFVFAESAENTGRRPFPRGESCFEMATMGRAIVVSATNDLLQYVKGELEGKERDEAFSMPYVYGHSLYYLPDLDIIRSLPIPDCFELEVVEQPDITALYSTEGFRNAIQYDESHPRPDVLVTLARHGNQIAAMAGASADCGKMWQIGIDVKPEYRRFGLAAALVSRLGVEILERGYVPYYGTASSNIPSQRVAHRAGFCPAWMCVYKGHFDGFNTLPTS